MKWFKHYSDMHRGQSINRLLDELGHTGLCFFILQEMCAEKLEKKGHESLTDSDCLFNFHQRIVRQNLRISAANLRRLLDICAEVGLLSFEFSGNSLQISMPILLNLLDRDSISARKTRANSAKKTRLDKEEDKDKDKDKEEEIYISSEPTKSVAEEAKNPRLPALVKSSEKPIRAVSKIRLTESVEVDVAKDLILAWSETYDKEFLESEFKKARNWVLANSHKAPKKDWGRFFNNWFSRGWEQYRKSLKSNQPGLSLDDLNDLLGVA